mmetsp:Transcript_71304/g.189618  ORF Transcript_71304/g.189618 Transcript_71304/m.189618 type:complete len:82 (+) Transcript_71304:21-266(+)
MPSHLRQPRGQRPKVGQQAGARTAAGCRWQALLAAQAFIGRGEGLQPQMTSEYSVIVRSVENLAIEDAAWMLRLHHFALSA